ncbi:MAG: hypothetical protein LKF52_15625 [Butyrivibrio sp.]|jgi:hypothetical protein|nr:hypothetical protein [Butyrivibrio sp.]
MTKEEYIREIDEALAAGRSAMGALDEADGCLKSARNWGIFDILGGGMISSFIKHERLSRAQDLVQQAGKELQRFNKELSDIQMQNDVRIRCDGLTQAIDIFFDNVLVDVMVQSKIADLQRQMAVSKQQVQSTIERLEQMKRQA